MNSLQQIEDFVRLNPGCLYTDVREALGQDEAWQLSKLATMGRLVRVKGTNPKRWRYWTPDRAPAGDPAVPREATDRVLVAMQDRIQQIDAEIGDLEAKRDGLIAAVELVREIL